MLFTLRGLRLALPGVRHRAVRVVIAAPAGAQHDLTAVAVPVHGRHALPRPLVVLGDVRLVAGAEPGRELVVVDRPDSLVVKPGEDEALVGEREIVPNRFDALPLAERVSSR